MSQAPFIIRPNKNHSEGGDTNMKPLYAASAVSPDTSKNYSTLFREAPAGRYVSETPYPATTPTSTGVQQVAQLIRHPDYNSVFGTSVPEVTPKP